MRNRSWRNSRPTFLIMPNSSVKRLLKLSTMPHSYKSQISYGYGKVTLIRRRWLTKNGHWDQIWMLIRTSWLFTPTMTTLSKQTVLYWNLKYSIAMSIKLKSISSKDHLSMITSTMKKVLVKWHRKRKTKQIKFVCILRSNRTSKRESI